MTGTLPSDAKNGKGDQRATVLIVDDDPDLRQLLSKELEVAGFVVIGVADGQTALDTLDEVTPDVLVIDVLMPNMDGYELTKRIRTLPAASHVPIIILTALNETDDLVRGLDAGADDYLVKPFGPAELLARVRAKIRRAAETSLQPLTRLPGNIAIDRELNRRLRDDVPWALLYVDMDNFKAFNDVYGFVHGDEAIVMLGRILLEVSHAHGAHGDFVGHIGGDDFVVVTTPPQAEPIAQEAIEQFDRDIRTLYSREDSERGTIVTKDRRGIVRSFPLMTISIGIISCERSSITNLAQIGEIAAELKHFAKSKPGSVYVKDQRK
jgi:diguanylate cyclase (GGDEF)-like protein